LSRSDIQKLEQQIQLLKKSAKTYEDEWYIAMLEAIRNFMTEHPDQDKLVFEGEF